MLDLIIKNGECYINGNLEKKDIGISDNKIVEIGVLKDKSKETFDYLKKILKGSMSFNYNLDYLITKFLASFYK